MAPDRETAREVWANARPIVANVDEETGWAWTRLKRCLRKGKPNRRLIAEKVIDGVQWSLHATKGWRRRVVAA